MERWEIVSELESLLEVSPGTLRDDATIRDLEHWDSLKLLQILVFAEDRLGIEIDEDRLAKCVTLGDLLELMTQQR